MRQEAKQQQSLSQRVVWVFWEADFEPVQAIVWLGLLAWPACFLLNPPLLATNPTYGFLAFWPQSRWALATGVLFAWYSLSLWGKWRALHQVALAINVFWSLWTSYNIARATGGLVPIIFFIFAHALGTIWLFLRHNVKHDVMPWLRRGA